MKHFLEIFCLIATSIMCIAIIVRLCSTYMIKWHDKRVKKDRDADSLFDMNIDIENLKHEVKQIKKQISKTP